MSPREPGVKVVATNRQARRDYDILETVECGLVLRGSEVKSLRESRVRLQDAYARADNGEMWLHALHVTPYSGATGAFGHEPDRDRKLLLHKHEILRLSSRVDQDGLALVPVALYFRDGRAKLELALARGRRRYDKRQALAKRDAEREAQQALARSRRR
ncbi:MAG: SsrA-binding protein SmpB [Acidimicrobiales bacterium]